VRVGVSLESVLRIPVAATSSREHTLSGTFQTVPEYALAGSVGAPRPMIASTGRHGVGGNFRNGVTKPGRWECTYNDVSHVDVLLEVWAGLDDHSGSNECISCRNRVKQWRVSDITSPKITPRDVLISHTTGVHSGGFDLDQHFVLARF
jgi:hypothetical protein